ncbi:DUF3566 domain-containing protein [Mycobacterium sp. E1747]|uniref:DUF3566 domain-containing protein n=1 Tax=Mycobacterium sp. E1747 TaxID=1834128 RepID=UPI0007FF25DD|nr:DUF3566 domain-containing protein [Mycobacterium sp. E1747]OBH06565.1 hypothetical protein A5695_04930 [Mycobacterium sp. E1747]
MSSPNEPAAPKKGDGLNGDGSAERAGIHRATPPAPAGRAPDAGESPPWQQRGGARPPQAPQRQNEPPTEARPPAPSSGVEARLNRFVSGTAAPGAGAPPPGKAPSHDADAPGGRGDGPPSEAYASELPDLSGPIPRGPQRKTAPDRAPESSSLSGSGRSSGAESREGRDTRENRTQVSRRPRGPVRASMQIRRIDPWSTLKVSLLLSVALFFVWMIAVAFLYLVLGGMGVWSKLNSNVGDLLNNTSGSSGELVSSGTIFGGAVLIGLVNIVLLTAMATIAAFVYNLTTDLIGGIEVTLADRD